MPVLSEAAARSTHVHASSSWEIVFPDPGVPITAQTQVDYVYVTYTDLDGNKTTQVFQRLVDAAVYTQAIEGFWQAINEANGQYIDIATKDELYQEILTLMLNHTNTYGKDILPRDLKNAANEIEEHFGMEKTTW